MDGYGQGAPPPAGQPLAPASIVGPAPKKKSKKGLVIGCCSGCLVVLIGLCGFGGYLGYLEEGVDLSEPGDEVTSIQVTEGQTLQTPPVRLIQGYDDNDVPWEMAMAIMARIGHDDCIVTLIKDGDHRLSRPGDLAKIGAAICDLLDPPPQPAAQGGAD